MVRLTLALFAFFLPPQATVTKPVPPAPTAWGKPTAAIGQAMRDKAIGSMTQEDTKVWSDYYSGNITLYPSDTHITGFKHSWEILIHDPKMELSCNIVPVGDGHGGWDSFVIVCTHKVNGFSDEGQYYHYSGDQYYNNGTLNPAHAH